MTEKAKKTEDKKCGEVKSPKEKPKLKVIQGGKSDNKINENPAYFKDMDDYVLSAVAVSSYLSGGEPDVAGAKVALEQMYKQLGAVPKDKWEGARVGSLASPQGIVGAIKSYFGAYRKARESMTLEQVPKYYKVDAHLDKLGDEVKKNFYETFKGGESLEKIIEKVGDAQKVMKKNENKKESKEYKEAEEVIKKYSIALNILDQLENTKLEKIKVEKLGDLVLREFLKDSFSKAA